LWYTSELREFEAGILVTGDPSIQLPPIPPLAITEYETECPSICTEKLGQELHIWNSFPHMHQLGSEIWTTQWRNGSLINEIGRVEYWSFDHQQTQFVNFSILPGDRLNTHCVYDTSKKNTTTRFGLNSTDEMCMHFLGYYPRTPVGSMVCGYLSPQYSGCGADYLKYPNPSILDPPGGANKSFGAPTPCQKQESSSIRIPPHFLYALIAICLVYALY